MTDETMALTAAVNYQLGRACSLGAQHNALCGSATAEEVSDMFTEGNAFPDDCDCRISRLSSARVRDEWHLVIPCVLLVHWGQTWLH
jgi:hypothetical protein